MSKLFAINYCVKNKVSGFTTVKNISDDELYVRYLRQLVLRWGGTSASRLEILQKKELEDMLIEKEKVRDSPFLDGNSLKSRDKILSFFVSDYGNIKK